ncbi:MAG: sulfurtransferase [Wolinella succinogenes]|uniref:rhodanese-like domain-containing protein n=1 Tax=Wolinella succinogenes TaxID=844 RepID=UPI0016B3146E|nr:rhodanese-like domain-containing protein [Wolinella succinogenes]NLU33394.1 sulfurtransferase [Wolinella succinogenes]
MLKKVLLSLSVAGFVSSSLLASSGAGAGEVEKIIKQNKLQVVDYDYVLKRIGDGRIGSGKAIILDARPEVRYQEGRIPSSYPMPHPIPANMKDEYLKVLKDKPKDVEIITYCSGVACEKSPDLAVELIGMGYKNVKVYTQGIPEWKKHFYTDIGAKTAKALFDKDEALFIDARPLGKFRESTIPGSIGVSDGKFKELWGRLPMDPNTKVVVFCGGYECELSHSVAGHMVAMGYKNVMTYSGGTPEWKKAGYPMTGGAAAAPAPKPAAAKEAPKNMGPIVLGEDEGTVDTAWFNSILGKKPENVTIVDIRGPADHAKGKFAGSINIEKKGKSAQEFVALLPKDQYIILTCATGTRSLEAWLEISGAGLLKDKVFYLDATIKCEGGACKGE